MFKCLFFAAITADIKLNFISPSRVCIILFNASSVGSMELGRLGHRPGRRLLGMVVVVVVVVVGLVVLVVLVVRLVLVVLVVQLVLGLLGVRVVLGLLVVLVVLLGLRLVLVVLVVLLVLVVLVVLVVRLVQLVLGLRVVLGLLVGLVVVVVVVVGHSTLGRKLVRKRLGIRRHRRWPHVCPYDVGYLPCRPR